jgi:hypothetical protein
MKARAMPGNRRKSLKLEILPIDIEYRSINRNSVIEEVALCADLVVDGAVRIIERLDARAQSVWPARSKSGGHPRIDHQVRGYLVPRRDEIGERAAGR